VALENNLHSKEMKPNQNDWQPIETAPRDGNMVLGWYPLWNACRVCEWDEFDKLWIKHNGNTLDALQCQPTHWMPLPKGPENWKPIDTAPKDGRTLRIWFKDSDGWYFCLWDNKYNQWSTTSIHLLCIGGNKPTHWMEAPQSAQ